MDQDKLMELEKRIKSDYGNMAGMVVQKGGEILYENYFNGCTPESRLHVFSVTKSIVSALIGIAIEKGYVKSVSQKVLEFFPDYPVKDREKTIQEITLENLLTMTAPYKYRLPPYIRYFTSDDWVRFTLDQLGGKGKIGKFMYAGLIGPDLLTGILVRATGQSVLAFAEENLFCPLGITVEKNIIFQSKEEQMEFNQATHISGWVSDPAGVNTGGWGLTLSPVDMAKIGQLYLNGGMWEGKQIVPAEWITASTKEHSFWKKEGLPYGYLWWLDPEKEGFSAMGDGGNVIYVSQKNQMVVSIASLFQPKVKDRMELIKKYIEPLFL